MKTKTKMKMKMNEIDEDGVISWQLLLNLLLFRYKKLKYSKEIKIGITTLLWMDVIGVILFIWFIVKFFAYL